MRIRDYTRLHEGEPLMDLTAAELDAIAAGVEALWAKNLAAVDQARASVEEASECGCRIRLPLQPDGGHRDIGRAVVHHTCGRA
ncbi:MAG TPA: hypothetical protein VFZ64_02120 [Nocardioidaceae bacterium]